VEAEEDKARRLVLVSLFVCLFGWLVGWLVGWFVGWLVGSLVGMCWAGGIADRVDVHPLCAGPTSFSNNSAAHLWFLKVVLDRAEDIVLVWLCEALMREPLRPLGRVSILHSSLRALREGIQQQLSLFPALLKARRACPQSFHGLSFSLVAPAANGHHADDKKAPTPPIQTGCRNTAPSSVGHSHSDSGPL
jgi:hypothetical protein